MKHPHAMTVQACHQRQRLEPGLKARLDKVITALRLVPTAGLYDAQAKVWNAHVAGDLRITYTILDQPSPQIVILQIAPMTENWMRELRVPELAAG